MKLQVYNSLTGAKEDFEPLHPDFVGIYVCGPTVYSDVHIGNCRTFVNFDVIYRYFLYLGYRVRYVRNITDVGHLEGDADTNEAEDKISKKARVERVEPMEVAQRYTVGFHQMMQLFNTLPPSIEPRATGHIPEQIEMVTDILKRGLAYEANGSVYFDVQKFAETHPSVYGQLSGRILEDLQSETRDLKNQSEKRNPADFAIWMKAAPEHILRWNAPWSVGFPGWHLECSAMSKKYLGEVFDIHGGGNDLKFPHHENEIAQNMGACGAGGARYWLHANMLLLNGKKMSKSDGNYITPTQIFTGDSPHVTKAYSPNVVRFFFLQAHYRSTLDMNDEGLAAAEKGYKRLMETQKVLQSLTSPTASATNSALEQEINALIAAAHEDMNDDFNAPKALGRLFELATKVNALKGGQLPIAEVSAAVLTTLTKAYNDFISDIFGLKDESLATENGFETLDAVMQLVIDLRKQARTAKDFATSDKIRDMLKAAGIQLKDSKEGTDWVKD